MTIAKKLAKSLEELDCLECDLGFDKEPRYRVLSWDTVKSILRNYGGEWEECHCGSSYCSICNGSVDPSVEVTFPDGSVLKIENPGEVVFRREYSA